MQNVIISMTLPKGLVDKIDQSREGAARFTFSLSKKLHEIINQVSIPEIVLRAISELHRIEMSLHTLFEEVPGDIKTSIDFEREKKPKKEYLSF
jgi:hypothetical protein